MCKNCTSTNCNINNETHGICENRGSVVINGIKTKIGNHRNLLELIRSINIHIPTFCYHSDLSIYGACRLCIVEIEGKGIQASCSTVPEDGMVVRTNTNEIREIRRTIVELLLANHDQSCPTCERSDSCGLRKLSAQLGIEEVSFNRTRPMLPLDKSSASLVRDPNKCILCGDCVRACREIQGIGVLDFAHRGEGVQVTPAFNKALEKVECVNCGQCAAVCPTGALALKRESQKVWEDIGNRDKTVVAQVAPAVRVAIGEIFGQAPGTPVMGKLARAMRLLGFDRVFDTSFAADITVLEESTEFLARKTENTGPLPIFTSCCPAWVKYAEQFYPEFLPNLSSCKSPQQMFGSLARETLPKKLGLDNKDLVIVSVMPCTAKKFEAKRPEFEKDGIREVDHVITTTELASMIREAGIDFNSLEPASLDMPMGFKSGAGVIFGSSGGVSEAVLRYAWEKITDNSAAADDSTLPPALERGPEFKEIRGLKGIKTLEIDSKVGKLRLAVVQGLKNAHDLMEEIKKGNEHYDLVEVMACPGGCIGGAGQPVDFEGAAKVSRQKGLYNSDRAMQLHRSQDNPYVEKCYAETLGEPNKGKAHELLHTSYASRKRIFEGELKLMKSTTAKLTVKVCLGTGCFLRQSRQLLEDITENIRVLGKKEQINVTGTFCLENCAMGPNVLVGDVLVEKADTKKVMQEIARQIEMLKLA